MKKIEPIAIIGMAGRYPKSSSTEALWDNLMNGVDLSSQAAESVNERVSRFYELEDAALFDTDFFAYSLAEASTTDPQQRVLLECAFRALEDAGYEAFPTDVTASVFASTSLSTYMLNNLLDIEKQRSGEIDYPALLGNDKDFVASRVAYKLNLTGPALSVQSGCSSSLVATYQACQSLALGDCDISLVAASSITFPQNKGYEHKEGSIFSRDGVCRPFDQQASGTLKGNGCSVLVLKRLSDAERDNDRIYAVISGIAINNDGAEKIGYTAPSPIGQSKVIAKALDSAGLSPNDIDYIETHGTGTKLGDPIEIQALKTVFSGVSDKISLGSIKADLGHMDSAAGLTSLLKAALVLDHQVIPKLSHFDKENVLVQQLKHPFLFPVEARNRDINHVGVSSFGIGGTNAHAVLSKPKKQRESYARLPMYVVPLYLNRLEDLAPYIDNIKALLVKNSTCFHDFACTMATARKKRKVSIVVVAGSQDAFLKLLTVENLAAQFQAHPNLNKEAFDRFIAQLSGHDVHWNRSALPNYPFNKRLCWVEEKAVVKAVQSRALTGGGDSTLKAIVNIWQRRIDEEKVDANSDFFEVGGDSFAAIEIIDDVVKRFAVSLSTTEFNNHLTPKLLAKLVQEKLETQKVVVSLPVGIGYLRKSPSQNNIFLIHPAGGTTFCYSQLNRYIQGDYNIYSVDMPDSFAEHPSMQSLAALYLSELKKVQANGPYILGGYSFGGNLAYEIARQLERQGEAIARVIMFDSHLPTAYNTYAGDEINYDEVLPDILASYFNDHPLMDQQKNQLSNLSFEDSVQAMKSKGWLDCPLSVKELVSFFHRWVYCHGLLKNHEPEGVVNSDLLIFIGSEKENPMILEKLCIDAVAKTGWGSLFAGDMTAITVPGDHYSMLGDDQNLQALAKAFDEAWQQPQEVRCA